MSKAALSPVVLFAFNRPTHLRETLSSLAACRLAAHSEVYVFSDGPRSRSDSDLVAQVRSVLEHQRQSGSFAAFHVRASKTNKGLAQSIVTGVEEVISRHGQAIVLEDDLLMAPDFLVFMNDCLNYYRDDLGIGSISGYSPLEVSPQAHAGGVYLAGRSSSQGWGTWSRVWHSIDWRATTAQLLAKDRSMRRAFNAYGNDRYDRLCRQLAGHIDSWSIIFGLSLFLRRQSTVYPVVNRIRNIGYDGSGTHSGIGRAKNSVVAEASYRLGPLQSDRRIQLAFHRAYSGGHLGRLLREILALAPGLGKWIGRY